MTAEELKKKQQEELAANKDRFTRLAEYHQKEAVHYLKKADECDPVELDPQPAAKTFGGL